jgi:Uma2 family endonuclease
MKTPGSSEYRTVLPKITWQKYEALLAEMEETRTARFTFDRGRLEMMKPLEEHDRCSKLIESLLLVVTDELEQPITSYKAPTLKREDLQIGTEPDVGYYIQNCDRMDGRRALDLAVDPPPDLILEVELSRSALNKFAIYAKLGIPEVWRYISKPGDTFLKGQLFIHYLDGDRYLEADHGLAFPFLPAGRILQFIDQSDVEGLPKALRDLRLWVETMI